MPVMRKPSSWSACLSLWVASSTVAAALGLPFRPVRLSQQLFDDGLVQLHSVSLGDIGVIESHHVRNTLPEEVVVGLVEGQLVGSLLQVRLHVQQGKNSLPSEKLHVCIECR